MPPRSSTPRRKQRQAAERAGRWAEIIAWLYYSVRGCHCLGRRMRSPFGEIDLIMKRGRRLVFVEVKFRTDKSTSEQSLPIKAMRNSDCDHALHHYTLTINRVTLPARGNVSSDRPFSECSETL